MLNVALLLSHHSRQKGLFIHANKLKNHDIAVTCWSTKHFEGMIYRTDHKTSVKNHRLFSKSLKLFASTCLVT